MILSPLKSEIGPALKDLPGQGVRVDAPEPSRLFRHQVGGRTVVLGWTGLGREATEAALRSFGKDGEAPKALESAREYFRRQASVVEAELGDGRAHLLGEPFSVADVLLATTLDWAVFYGESLSTTLESYRAHPSIRAPVAV